MFSPFELKNMMDESSLEIFESQSHLLDPETRLQLQKQRQYLEWQNSMEESGPMRSCLERTDSAGSGSEATDVAVLRQELRALKAEREAAAQRMNEMCHQVQDKKRQLFSAIQEREQLKERVRQGEAKLKEYQEVMHCRLCHTVRHKRMPDFQPTDRHILSQSHFAFLMHHAASIYEASRLHRKTLFPWL